MIIVIFILNYKKVLFIIESVLVQLWFFAGAIRPTRLPVVCVPSRSVKVRSKTTINLQQAKYSYTTL